MKVFGGTLVALALLAVGFIFLPSPEGAPAPQGIFTILWLLVAAFSAFAFGRELWLMIRLRQIRRRWMRPAKKRAFSSLRSGSQVTPLRERERRLS